MILPFCESVHAWLMEKRDHVVGIHCKAGKGRTGLMVACYLLYSGLVATAVEALKLFGLKRTLNGKGVTIPSQQRYAWYFEQMMLRKLPRDLSLITPTFQLAFVRLVTVPNFDIETGCDPYFEVAITNKNRKCAAVHATLSVSPFIKRCWCLFHACLPPVRPPPRVQCGSQRCTTIESTSARLSMQS